MFIIAYIITGIFCFSLVLILDQVRFRVLSCRQIRYQRFYCCIFYRITDLGFVRMMDHGSFMIYKINICAAQIQTGYIRD